MSTFIHTIQVSRDRVWTRVRSSIAIKCTLTLALALATAACAQVDVHLWFNPYVPFTLQLFPVFLSGVVLGSGFAGASMGLYLLMGLLLPFFAGGSSGPAVLFGATGGYLLGFPIAAELTARLVGPGRKSWARVAVAVLAGLAVIHALGVVQLAIVAKLGLAAALAYGSLPFIGFDLAKAAVAIVCCRSAMPSQER